MIYLKKANELFNKYGGDMSLEIVDDIIFDIYFNCNKNDWIKEREGIAPLVVDWKHVEKEIKKIIIKVHK